MKKTALISLLLAFLLCFSGCSEVLSLLWETNFFPPRSSTTAGGPSGPPKPSVEYVEDLRSYGYYYDQLSGNAKAVYRTILADSMNGDGIDIALKDEVSESGDPAELETIKSRLSDAVKDFVQPALDALIFDHPEIFWISMGDSTFSMSLWQEEKDGVLTVSSSVLSFKLAFKDGLTVPDIEETRNAIAEKVALYPPKASSRYETLLAVHDRLCEDIFYTPATENAHDVIGGLLDGRAVCDGYARAFKLLCDSYGIPSVIVAGYAHQNGRVSPHAWNCVQMEDGKWYGVDVTWDDDEKEPSLAYFLVGSKTKPIASGMSFSVTHQPSGTFSHAFYPPFSSPTLEDERYTPPSN